MGMVCPICASKTAVYNSRPSHEKLTTWRRRRCMNCKEVFTTYEKLDLSYLMISKRAGQTEPYARSKLFSSIYRAHYDPIVSNHLTDNIEVKLIKLRRVLVGSRDLADLVSSSLCAYDPASCARYRSFLS